MPMNFGGMAGDMMAQTGQPQGPIPGMLPGRGPIASPAMAGPGMAPVPPMGSAPPMPPPGAAPGRLRADLR